MPSTPIAAAIVGVVGTLAGGTLSAVVSIWNTRNTRKRDAELEAQRFTQAESVRRRAERIEAYRDWLSSWDDLQRSLPDGSAHPRAELAQLSKAATVVQLIGSGEAAAAARRSIEVLDLISAAVTGRPALVAELTEMRQGTQQLLRAELTRELR